MPGPLVCIVGSSDVEEFEFCALTDGATIESWAVRNRARIKNERRVCFSFILTILLFESQP